MVRVFFYLLGATFYRRARKIREVLFYYSGLSGRESTRTLSDHSGFTSMRIRTESFEHRAPVTHKNSFNLFDVSGDSWGSEPVVSEHKSTLPTRGKNLSSCGLTTKVAIISFSRSQLVSLGAQHDEK